MQRPDHSCKKEFVLGLSTISRGSPTEKLQWTFNLYDINGDGCITREEMREIITSIYSLLGRFLLNQVYHQKQPGTMLTGFLT
ncbi:calsenilin [Caerostris extrusa]|uniref:Calsenilin n=1 Tax=Caerostris extrusa TaxID=172846 RepID=A0AAV4NXQ3_CAEEX|nr:calsenilin [Caerostris extrusa]